MNLHKWPCEKVCTWLIFNTFFPWMVQNSFLFCFVLWYFISPLFNCQLVFQHLSSAHLTSSQKWLFDVETHLFGSVHHKCSKKKYIIFFFFFLHGLTTAVVFMSWCSTHFGLYRHLQKPQYQLRVVQALWTKSDLKSNFQGTWTYRKTLHILVRLRTKVQM